LIKSGVVVQHSDGSLEAVSPDLAERHLAEMDQARRTCYEEISATPSVVS
jgi:hypothetical protein